MTQATVDQTTQDTEEQQDPIITAKQIADMEAEFIKQFLNAPKTMPEAIERIMELEMRLEDLARASEIAEITNNVGMMESFRREALESIDTKITYDRPIPKEKMQITLITNEPEETA